MNDGSNREAEADRNLKASDRRLPASWLNKSPPDVTCLIGYFFFFHLFCKVPSTEPVTALVESLTLDPPRRMEIRIVCHFDKDPATIESPSYRWNLFFLWKKGLLTFQYNLRGGARRTSAELREAASSRPRTTERKPAELNPRFSGSSKEVIENAIGQRCWVIPEGYIPPGSHQSMLRLPKSALTRRPAAVLF